MNARQEQQAREVIDVMESEKHEKFPVSDRLVQALLEIIPAEELPAWLQTPNPGFAGRNPWTLIHRGERDVIWEMIHQTRLGMCS